MKKLMTSLLIIVLFAAAGRGEFVEVKKLSENVLLLNTNPMYRANLIAVRSQKGLVMIDTEISPSVMRPVKQRIEKEFGRNDWIYVINTHGHMHHAYGNCLFEGVKIIGHENLPADMQWKVDLLKEENKQKLLEEIDSAINNQKENLKNANAAEKQKIERTIEFCNLIRKDVESGSEIVFPNITFSDRYNLDLNDIKIELIYFGKGHSNSDILVYIPSEKVLVTSGVCYGRLPAIKENVTLADIERHISVLGEFVKDGIQINHIIPAHDESITQKDLQNHYKYYHGMLEEIKSAKQKGLGIWQVKKNLTVKDKFPFFIKNGEEPLEEIEKKHLGNIDNLWKMIEN